MFEPTVILAAVSVIGHSLVIFWPRKPLKERLDENGFPILWCNNNDKQENVACVWKDASEQSITVVHEEVVHRRSA
jgi:hypothetical protein